MRRISGFLWSIFKGFLGNTRFNYGQSSNTGRVNTDGPSVAQVKPPKPRKELKSPVAKLNVLKAVLPPGSQAIFNQFVIECSKRHPADMKNIINNASDLYAFSPDVAVTILDNVCQLGLQAKKVNGDWYSVMRAAFATLTLNRVDLHIKTFTQVGKKVIGVLKRVIRPGENWLKDYRTEYDRLLAEDKRTGRKSGALHWLNGVEPKRRALEERTWWQKLMDNF